ncbi:MAG: hypothetical protein D3906_16120 [Candidatus Electrothrix sp. AUS1_2]|nr:hypothetical protein [Candidatus Electrothrix sp. AUS1_2]
MSLQNPCIQNQERRRKIYKRRRIPDKTATHQITIFHGKKHYINAIMTIKKKNAQRISRDSCLFSGPHKSIISARQPRLQEEPLIFHAEKQEMKV